VSPDIEIAFSLNGRRQTLAVPAELRLIDLLRDHFGMTAAKKACGIGRCGACSVLVDDRAVHGCLLMPWQLDGTTVITPEGLDDLPAAVVLREALVAENAFQCGYCAPGFTIALTALLRENPAPDTLEIRAALEGNICRCTGYHSIIRGALAAVEALGRGTRT